MHRRDLAVFLGLELAAIVWAGALFSMLESKRLAGALAGGYFLVSGVYMLYRANRWSRKWNSATWYLLMVHVFMISTPMLVSRFLQRDLDFAQLRVLGIPGPLFHNISSGVFGALMVATVLDWIRCWWVTRRNPQEIN